MTYLRLMYLECSYRIHALLSRLMSSYQYHRGYKQHYHYFVDQRREDGSVVWTCPIDEKVFNQIFYTSPGPRPDRLEPHHLQLIIDLRRLSKPFLEAHPLYIRRF